MKRDLETLLLKLADGARILRFNEPAPGLCLSATSGKAGGLHFGSRLKAG